MAAIRHGLARVHQVVLVVAGAVVAGCVAAEEQAAVAGTAEEPVPAAVVCTMAVVGCTAAPPDVAPQAEPAGRTGANL